MAIARTVPVPAEAHTGHCSSSSDYQLCLNCKKPCHMSEFCIQPGGGMAGKTIAEARQVHNVKCGKKSKDKTKDAPKGTTGSIIQSGNQAFIVDADGKAHEIVGPTSLTPSVATTTADSAHFLQTDDLE